jgi:DNA polymerase III subunit epsilon
LFAIVDIETTGGNAAQGAITEIAVLLHNGKEVEERFSTLINPECLIPQYITALTGIDNRMVANAPRFEEIATTLFGLLQNRIFVAHNVNFDHSFLHHWFKESDILFQPRKLCTVRYARKVVPGLPSYSLGNLCRSLNIPIEDRHRAAGDAEATGRLFNFLLASDEGGEVLKEMTRGRNAHSYLPMNVAVEEIEALPYCPGVYYFKDKTGKVVYVGKAVNLKYRVKSHFTNNAAGKRRQEMLRNIYAIEYTTCATEMMAIVLESIEIKRLWPLYNRSQKRYEATYGLYPMEDRAGRLRLLVDKKKKYLPALHTFSQPTEGYDLVSKLAGSLDLNIDWVFGQYQEGDLLPADFNQRMKQLMAGITDYLPDFAIIEKGADLMGKESYVVYQVVKGSFKGMGCSHSIPKDWEQANTLVTPYPENEFIRSTLYSAMVRQACYVISPEKPLIENGK